MVCRKRGRTTISVPGVRVCEDLVDRAFLAAAPDRLWVADITYLRTWEGWLYLIAVQDLFSRRIVGWSMADHMRTELVTDALQMALAQRRPTPGLIWHSDHGSQGGFTRSSQHLDEARPRWARRSRRGRRRGERGCGRQDGRRSGGWITAVGSGRRSRVATQVLRRPRSPGFQGRSASGGFVR